MQPAHFLRPAGPVGCTTSRLLLLGTTPLPAPDPPNPLLVNLLDDIAAIGPPLLPPPTLLVMYVDVMAPILPGVPPTAPPNPATPPPGLARSYDPKLLLLPSPATLLPVVLVVAVVVPLGELAPSTGNRNISAAFVPVGDDMDVGEPNMVDESDPP